MNSVMEKKYLLCRPEGGLNDLLCQIQKCYKYAKRHNRILIVDTNYRGSSSFKDKFSNYFKSNEKTVFLDIDQFGTLETKSIYPNFLAGRENSYQVEWNQESNNFVDSETNQLIKIDFKKLFDYKEKLIVHHVAGGGKKSASAFSWLQLDDNVLNEIASRINRIGAKFIALHIRNTDLKAKYEDKVIAIAKKNKNPVYVATDNKKSLDFCRSVFINTPLHNYSTLPENPGTTLHIHAPNTKPNTYKSNIDAIADLFILALSNKLHLFNIENMKKPKWKRYSGFSRLARNIRSCKRYLPAVGGVSFLEDNGIITSRYEKAYYLTLYFLGKVFF